MAMPHPCLPNNYRYAVSKTEFENNFCISNIKHDDFPDKTVVFGDFDKNKCILHLEKLLNTPVCCEDISSYSTKSVPFNQITNTDLQFIVINI